MCLVAQKLYKTYLFSRTKQPSSLENEGEARNNERPPVRAIVCVCVCVFCDV